MRGEFPFPQRFDTTPPAPKLWEELDLAENQLFGVWAWPQYPGIQITHPKITYLKLSKPWKFCTCLFKESKVAVTHRCTNAWTHRLTKRSRLLTTKEFFCQWVRGKLRTLQNFNLFTLWRIKMWTKHFSWKKQTLFIFRIYRKAALLRGTSIRVDVVVVVIAVVTVVAIIVHSCCCCHCRRCCRRQHFCWYPSRCGYCQHELFRYPQCWRRCCWWQHRNEDLCDDIDAKKRKEQHLPENLFILCSCPASSQFYLKVRSRASIGSLPLSLSPSRHHQPIRKKWRYLSLNLVLLAALRAFSSQTV